MSTITTIQGTDVIKDSRSVINTNFANLNADKVETASNLGAGSQLFKQKSTTDLQFRSLVAGAGISITQNTNDVTIAATTITTLNGLTAQTQTFAKTDDTNVTLTITSTTSTHTFALGWTGTLAKARQHSATVYNDQANTFGAFVQTFQAGANFLLVDPTDTTKKLSFAVSNISTSTTRTVTLPNSNTTIPIISQILTFSGPTAARTYTLPDASDTLVTLTATQTLTNKTLTTPTIGDFSNATHSHQNSAGGGTLDGAAIAAGTVAAARLGTMTGDSGSGGAKGAVPAPAAGDAASSKFLKADGTWSVPAGAGDVSSNTATSVDSEVVLFSGTTGKTIKRATGSGLAKFVSGVLSTVTAPSGAVVGDTDTQTLTNKTIAGGSNTLSGITETMMSTSDITTLDVSTTKHGFVPKAPNNDRKFLDGTGAWSSPNLRMRISTAFETSGRFTLTTGNTGANTFGVNGLSQTTGATSGSFAKSVLIATGNSNFKALSGSPIMTCSVLASAVASLTFSAYWGFGNLTVAGSGHTMTNNHIGFKITNAGGTAQLFATQADGTTENVSSALTNVADGDVLDLIIVINGTSSVDYYWRLNGGAFSSATNLTSNMPTNSSSSIGQCSISNNSTANTATLIYAAMSYER